MAESSTLSIAALPHPDRDVRRLGFDLTHPYIELCWGAVVGPSATMILRRLPLLWAEAEPVVADADRLARSFGLRGHGGISGTFGRALDRLTYHRLASWMDTGESIAVYTQAPPLSGRRLERLPRWTRQVHDQLIAGRDAAIDVPASAASTDDRARLAAYARAAAPAPGRSRAHEAGGAWQAPNVGRTTS